ncbi:MAG: RNA methyltransferase [Desulfomonile tiedjei]|uniref:tRNA (cytidine/uridine-2'-O-)-methyltransferase TrmJ n=1 Tax=Desulfomonile tiedjei TaxID=2358 RepID=A0A9D6Z3S9_9BACT|nr:RNA methyltransferase [Desulfomonile tiedjei]
MRPSRRVQRGFRVHPDWEPALENVQIVMMGITHPGNIGAVARVMKNMALKKLILVSSTECGPETDAFAMSSGAYDIIQSAVFHDDPAKALEGTVMAVGTSARLGGKRLYAGTPDAVIPELMARAAAGPVAIVFGRESRGLTNEELKLCTHHMIIPSDAEFASMNVAQAVTVTAYEIFKTASRPVGFQAKKFRHASAEVREEMYDHVQQVLLSAGFLEESNPLRMMRDIRRILNSAEMDDRDVKIIRGIFRKIGNAVRIQRKKAAAALEKVEKE